MDIPHLKTITQAGGKLNDDLNLEFSKFCKKEGKRFFVMYGQTEAISRISILDYKFLKKYKGSVGKPLRGYKIWISKKNEQSIFVSALKKKNFRKLLNLIYETVRRIHVTRFPYNHFLYPENIN